MDFANYLYICTFSYTNLNFFVMEFSAKEIAEFLKGDLEGNPDAKITGFARIEAGKPGTLSFFANMKYEHFLYTSGAEVMIINRSYELKQPLPMTVIRVDDAYTAIASLLEYVAAKKKKYRRHRGWFVRRFWSTKIGKKVSIGDFAYIGRRTVVGDYTKIYPQVFIGEDVTIGRCCTIYSGVRIYPGTVIGDNCILHANVVVGSDGFGYSVQPDGSHKKIEHTGNVIIEDDVEIGANSTVDRSTLGSTIIHKGVKIDNLCQVAHNVEVGADTVMCAMSAIAGSSKVGERCILGGQSGVSGHISIANGTKIGGQAGVITAVKKEGVALLGTPAIEYGQYYRAYALFRKSAEKQKK